MYETTDLRQAMQHKRLVSAAEAYRRASPAQRAHWFPTGPPAGAAFAGLTGHGSGASWDTPPDPAGLERAKRAGMTALAEGHGGVLPNGMAPCGTCPACDAGYPQRCRRPQSKAMATLRAAQARDADRTRDQVVAAELAMLHVELSAALD